MRAPAALRLTVAIALLLGVAPGRLAAQSHAGDDTELNRCLAGSDANRSSDVAECVIHAAELWTRRMERAYQQLLVTLDPHAGALLRKSQADWKMYRVSNIVLDHALSSKMGSAGRLNSALLREREVRNRALLLESYQLAR